MEKYTNRKEYLDKLLSYKDKDLIKVISGLRRCGKSTLLELYREHLLKQGIGKRQTKYKIFLFLKNWSTDFLLPRIQMFTLQDQMHFY